MQHEALTAVLTATTAALQQSNDGMRAPIPVAGEALRAVLSDPALPAEAVFRSQRLFQIGGLSMLAGSPDALPDLLAGARPPVTDWLGQVITQAATAWYRLALGDPSANQIADQAHDDLVARQQIEEPPFLERSDDRRRDAIRLIGAYHLCDGVRRIAQGDTDAALRAALHAEDAANRGNHPVLWEMAHWVSLVAGAAPLPLPPAIWPDQQIN